MQEWPRSAPMPAHEKSQPLTSQGSVMNSLCSPRGWIYQCFVWATFWTYCTENCAYCKQSPTDILSLPHGWIYKNLLYSSHGWIYQQHFVLATRTSINDNSVLTTWMSLSITFSTTVLFSSSSSSDSISLSISFRYQPIRSDLRRPASLSATATFLLQPLLFPS